MKKTLTFIIGLAAIAAGCTKETHYGEGAPVPIELGSGLNIVPKAPIDEKNPDITGAGIAGWETADATPAFAGNPTWNTTISTTANTTAAQPVKWTATQYYKANGDYTHMQAWYPGGTITGTEVTFENTKGDQDVLYASVSGSKNDHEDKVLNFQHMTSQLKFEIKAGAGLAAGTTLTSIKINNAELPVGFNLIENGAAVVKYAQAGQLEVSGITDQAITGTATSAGEPVMIKPMGTTALTLDIQTSEAEFANQTVTIDEGEMKAGSAYTITLTFSQKEISLGATVTEWKQGTGSAEIQ